MAKCTIIKCLIMLHGRQINIPWKNGVIMSNNIYIFNLIFIHPIKWIEPTQLGH